MTRREWQTVGVGMGLSAVLVLVAFGTAALLAESGGQEHAVMAVLWPLFVAVRGVTGLFDYLGPAGLPEPWSHFAPWWAVRILVGLSIALAAVTMVAFAEARARWGARAAAGTWLIPAGFSLATSGLSESVGATIGSVQGLIGVAVGLAGLYVLCGGISSRMKGSRIARWATLSSLSATVVAGVWLAYVAWFNGRP